MDFSNWLTEGNQQKAMLPFSLQIQSPAQAGLNLRGETAKRSAVFSVSKLATETEWSGC